MINVNTFFDLTLTAGVVLRRLRNALSHPSAPELDASFPSSGYTTMRDGSPTIARYSFVNSPDVRNSRPKMFSTQKEAETHLQNNCPPRLHRM